MKTLNYFHANWHAPAHVHALTTTRHGGNSLDAYHSNNFGLHVEDKQVHVEANRKKLLEDLALTTPPIWLNQIHSNRCIHTEDLSCLDADAIITNKYNTPLAIMTADCLPIMLCHQDGHEIAAIHAGWRGLANGIIENTVSKMKSDTANILAWIGPAICQDCFSIMEDVKVCFESHYPYLSSAFKKQEEKYCANLALIAELILNQLGILKVYQSNACTFEQDHEFYSYRKTAKTGRMATLIWIEKK